METVYLTLERPNNVIDMGEYRRKRELQCGKSVLEVSGAGDCAAPETRPETEDFWAQLQQALHPANGQELMELLASGAMIVAALSAAVAVLG
jgi:hypothetical protein